MTIGRFAARLFAVLSVVSTSVMGAGMPASAGGDELPLGPVDLAETRTTIVVQPGVTLTLIVRGEPDPTTVWTVEVAIPGGDGSPDPDHPPTAVADRQHADALAAELSQRGFTARVEEVVTPALADYPGGQLGFRVRVGRYPDSAEADATLGA